MFSWISARLRAHFGFSKTEINGTLVLLLLTSLCLLVSQGLRWYYSVQPALRHDQDIALLERTLSLLEAQVQRPKHTPKKVKKDLGRAQLLEPFDINIASEAQLCTIKGIGPVLSARIVKFRDRLGGFISRTQYQEVYGLSPEVVEHLKERTYINASFRPVQLDINSADTQTLATHPYITYKQAQNIVYYRAQHGPFLTAEALSALVLIDASTFKKLNPYLCASQ